MLYNLQNFGWKCISVAASEGVQKRERKTNTLKAQHPGFKSLQLAVLFEVKSVPSVCLFKTPYPDHSLRLILFQGRCCDLCSD